MQLCAGGDDFLPGAHQQGLSKAAQFYGLTTEVEESRGSREHYDFLAMKAEQDYIAAKNACYEKYKDEIDKLQLAPRTLPPVVPPMGVRPVNVPVEEKIGQNFRVSREMRGKNM
jgi:hypothetical protein